MMKCGMFLILMWTLHLLGICFGKFVLKGKTNLLTLCITNVNLSLLLIGSDDSDEELNKNVFKFVHNFHRFYWKIIVFYNLGSHGIHIVYVIWYLISW